MDDTVSGLWKRCEKLEEERDALQAKLDVAVEALKHLATCGIDDYCELSRVAEVALAKLDK